jgi:signal transduction histidine kinase
MNHPQPPSDRPAPPAFEAWLSSPWRRTLLVWAAAGAVALVTTLLWADAIAGVGREVDWGYLFRRRMLEWGLWALAFEPLVALSGLLARWLKPVALLVVVHGALSVGTGLVLHEADRHLAETWLGSPGQDRAPAERRGFDPTSPHRPPPPWAERIAARARLSRNLRAQSGIAIYWLIIGLGWAGRSFLRHRDQERRAQDLELRASKLEADLSSAQLSQLEAQLHPHFLFNALHSVGGLVRGGRNEQALSTLAALGDLLRATLEHGATPEVCLADELDLVETYLDVEHIRLGERLEVNMQAEPETGQAKLPALMLLPLVENAVKHAIAPRTEGGRIELHARREGDQVVIELRDDGPGFPPAVLSGAGPATGGIGLSNTRARAEAFFGPQALTLDNPEGGGARVVLRVPCPEPATDD